MENKVYFKTTDGFRLCGMLSRSQHMTKKCVILCHGWLSDKKAGGLFTTLANGLITKGFSTFRFDFRGHGESQGKTTDFTIGGQLKDLEGALKILKKQYERIGILGASFAGGAVSLFAAKYQNIVKAIVLGNALIDYDYLLNPITKWGRKYFNKEAVKRIEESGILRLNFFTKIRLNKNFIVELKTIKPWEKLLEVRAPVLFLQGDKDDCIPLDQSMKYASLVKNATLKIFNGVKHEFLNSSSSISMAKKEVVEFMYKNL